jgi:hypothetical protein
MSARVSLQRLLESRQPSRKGRRPAVPRVYRSRRLAFFAVALHPNTELHESLSFVLGGKPSAAISPLAMTRGRFVG